MYSLEPLEPKFSPSPNPKFDEKQWVIQIRRTLDEKPEEEIENPVTIFTVPRVLMSLHQYSYIPQMVAIGPCHYTKDELHDMERYKLAAAKRNQKEFQNLKIEHFVEHLMVIESKIRACYHRFLNYSGETLAWMLAVDASFLLEFLQVCAVKQGKASSAVITSRLSHLVDLAGNRVAHNAILRDISMLENQIPLFVLRKLLESHFSSSEKADEMLFLMLLGLCEELSPFRMVEDYSSKKIHVQKCSHLLDVLYHFVVPKLEPFSHSIKERDVRANEEEQEEPDSDPEEGCLNKVLTTLKTILDFIKRIIFSKPVKIIVKLPWTILSKLPILKVIKEPIENFFGLIEDDDAKGKDGSTSSIMNKPPLLEEITIPSVTQLAKAGVRIVPTKEGIASITFDAKTRTLSLPIISLDINSGVVLRNLVAYEACTAFGPLVLARYTELMNGIIDTEEDSKFLREKGIIVNRLKSDKEVANLWNGMNKSIRLTKVPFLDKVVEDVNKYYNGKWKVIFSRWIKRYVYGSWRLLALLGAMLLIALMALQAFCSVYNCARVVRIKNLS